MSVSKTALFFAVALMIGTMTIGGFSASAAPAGAPPKGLMIQVSSLPGSTSPAKLKRWLEDIRLHHGRSSSAYINAVVVQDIADKTGALYTPYLDVIAPYLPGGATPIFIRAYVGTVDLAWTGAGSKYIEGIENQSFRAQNLNVSRTAAAAFKARYPAGQDRVGHGRSQGHRSRGGVGRSQ
ncbi:MAG: hypothetical protein M3400_02335 [Actinomycetota bacterium]|nr:hypothetical protein [Actinomycetota bacterium]